MTDIESPDGLKLFVTDGIREYLALDKRFEHPHIPHHDPFEAIFAVEHLALHPEVSDAIRQVRQILIDRYGNEGWVDEELSQRRLKYQSGDTSHSYYLHMPRVGYKLYSAVKDAQRKAQRTKALEIVELLGSESSMRTLQRLGQTFCERDDLNKPFGPDSPIPYANWNRQFKLKIGAQEFTCTLVISDINERNCSFMLESPAGKKHGPCIGLHPYKNGGGEQEVGVSEQKDMLVSMLQIAVSAVEEYRKMTKNIESIYSGEKYGNLDIFGTAIALINYDGEDGPAKDVLESAEDPVAVIALSYDMFAINCYNSGLSAAELASISVKDERELALAMKDDAKFIYHVARGLMLLFKKVMTIGATGAPELKEDDIEIDFEGLMKITGGDEFENSGYVGS